MAPKRKMTSRGGGGGSRGGAVGSRKRGGGPAAAGGGGRAAPRKRAADFDLGGGGDEYISGGSDDEEGMQGQKPPQLLAGADAEEEEMQETAAEKRVRLAKQYLAQVEAAMDAEGSEEDSEEEDAVAGAMAAGPADALAARLERERLRAAGQLRRPIAGGLVGLELGPEATRLMKGHRLAPTCVAVSADERWAFSGGKDDAVFQYDLEAGRRVAALSPLWSGKQDHQAHEKEVLALAVSSDGRFLAAGGRDKEIRIWDLRSSKLVKTFPGHRDAVAALAFRADSHALYSGSWDRTLKHWNLDGLAYVETLFGHQAEINGMDAWRRERPVTCGRDRTVRVWKLVDESHMLLRCPHPEPGQAVGATGPLLGGSLDCVAMCAEDAYVTGGEDGALALWSLNRKKPTAVVGAAHGGPRHWIASVAALKGSDLVASGADDGFVRLWQASLTPHGHGSTLTPVAALPCPGYVNGLAFGRSGELLVAAAGKEHRLGRWAPVKEAKNGVLVMRLPEQERGIGEENDSDSEEEEEEEEESEGSGEGGSGSEEEEEEGGSEEGAKRSRIGVGNGKAC